MSVSNPFEGTVVGIPSSFRIIVQPFSAKAPLVTLIPACIRVPSGNDEPLSFAARDLLRKHFLGQEVHCSYVKEHARISRLSDGLEVTVALVRAGLATCNELDRVYNDFASHKRELLELQEAAARRGVGLHDPCLRGLSTLRRLQPFPSRSEDPVTRQQVVKAILGSTHTFRFSVEKILTATSFAGYLVPSLQSVSVRLLGLKPPRSENLARSCCQKINAKMMHRVVTIVVHGFDDDTGEFIIELTSAAFKRMFAEWLQQGLLVNDRSLQLPSAADAACFDRVHASREAAKELAAEPVLRLGPCPLDAHDSPSEEGADIKNYSLLPAANTAGTMIATPAGVAPAGLGADSPPTISRDVSVRRSPTAGPKSVVSPGAGGPAHTPSALPSPGSEQHGIDIAISFGAVFSSTGEEESEGDRRVAKMAADLVGDLLGDGIAVGANTINSPSDESITLPHDRRLAMSDASTGLKSFPTSPDQHSDAQTNMAVAAKTHAIAGGGVVVLGEGGEILEPLPAPARLEDRLPWRERLPDIAEGRYRRGLVVGVPNEATLDILEERSARSGSRRGGGRRGGGGTTRELFKIRVAGLNSPVPYVTEETPQGSLRVLLPARELAVREQLRRLLIGQEVQFYLTRGLNKQNSDNSLTAIVYLSVKDKEAVANPRESSPPSAPENVDSPKDQAPLDDQCRSRSPAASSPSPTGGRSRGWLDVSHYARAFADTHEIDVIHAEFDREKNAAAFGGNGEDTKSHAGEEARENGGKGTRDEKRRGNRLRGVDSSVEAESLSSNGLTNSAGSGQTQSGKGGSAKEEDEAEAFPDSDGYLFGGGFYDDFLLDSVIPRPEDSIFDFEKFGRMLQRGVPTEEELGCLMSSVWALKPTAPIMIADTSAQRTAASDCGAHLMGGEVKNVAAPAAIDASPVHRASRNTTPKPPADAHAETAYHAVDNGAGDLDPAFAYPSSAVDYDAPTAPAVEINFISSDSLVKSLEHIGGGVADLLLQQYVPGVIEEFTSPNSYSVYVPTLGLQLPFELKHAVLPPPSLEAYASPSKLSPDEEQATDKKDTKEKERERARRGGRDGGKGKGKGGPAKEEPAVSSTTSPMGGGEAQTTLSDRDKAVHNTIYEFLEDCLVHRDCLILTESIDVKRGSPCLIGSLAIPLAQLPYRWRNRLSPTKGLPPLLPDEESFIAIDVTNTECPSRQVDLLHALVSLGFCSVTPSRAVVDLPFDVVTQVVAAQDAAREKKLGIWDPQCGTLQHIAQCLPHQRTASATASPASPSAATASPPSTPLSAAGIAGVATTGKAVVPLITPDSPRATMRARRIMPIRRLDPVSFSFMYNDKENTEQMKALQELLRSASRTLPRTARIYPGDLIVICKRTVKITKRKPAPRAAKGKSGKGCGKEADSDKDKEKDKEPDEIREEIITYHRATVMSKVVAHHCKVDLMDANERDVSVHLRDIRLPDEEGKIERFTRLVNVCRHSYIHLSVDAQRLLAAKIEEETEENAAKESAEKGGKGGEGKKDKDKAKSEGGEKRGGKRSGAPRLTKAQQEKAAQIQKDFDAIVALIDTQAKRSCLWFSADYSVGNEVFGFLFESDDSGRGPHPTLPPATVSLLRECPNALNIDTSVADAGSVFVPFVRHLIDMAAGLGTLDVVLPKSSSSSLK